MTGMILWLEQVSKDDVLRVGGKGANLGELLRSGFPVPRAFSVTTLAYRKQVEQTPIQRVTRTAGRSSRELRTNRRVREGALPDDSDPSRDRGGDPSGLSDSGQRNPGCRPFFGNG